jgi:hypothetical protein
MGLLKFAAVGAGFSLMIAGIPQAEPVPSSQKFAFANDEPDVVLLDSAMKTRQYEFDMGDKSQKIKQGLYDEQLGVACTWTLVPNAVSKDMTPLSYAYSVATHQCSRGGEPRRWRSSAAISHEDMGALHTGGTMDLYGDKSKLLQISMDTYSKAGIGLIYTRLWDDANNQVCMKSLTLGDTPVGLFTVSMVDHGCFKMDRKDFVIQRAIATGPKIIA